MPSCARFRMGVRFDKLYSALPVSRQSKAGSWPQRINAMGFRLESTHCTHKTNINQEIAKHAPHPNKAFYVCACRRAVVGTMNTSSLNRGEAESEQDSDRELVPPTDAQSERLELARNSVDELTKMHDSFVFSVILRHIYCVIALGHSPEQPGVRFTAPLYSFIARALYGQSTST